VQGRIAQDPNKKYGVETVFWGRQISNWALAVAESTSLPDLQGSPACRVQRTKDEHEQAGCGGQILNNITECNVWTFKPFHLSGFRIEDVKNLEYAPV